MQKWYKSQVEFEICTIFAEDVIYFGWLLVGSLGSPTKTRLFRVPAFASIASQKLCFVPQRASPALPILATLKIEPFGSI